MTDRDIATKVHEMADTLATLATRAEGLDKLGDALGIPVAMRGESQSAGVTIAVFNSVVDAILDCADALATADEGLDNLAVLLGRLVAETP